jgi:ATP-dependent helicase/nuclease subunit B
MPRRPLHLVATERHVASALTGGNRAATFRSFCADVTANVARRPATPELTHLATAVALDDMRKEWDVSLPLVGAIDAAMGALRRSGVDPEMLRRTKDARGQLIGRLLARTDEMLARHDLFDDRAMGWIAATSIDTASIEELPTRVVIDGLYDWDPSQFAWVEALARRVPLTVQMPRAASGAVGVAAAPDAILSLLEARWQSLPRAPELELFELGLPEQATTIEAATDGAEARTIAAVVLDAVRAGASAEGIAIVVPQLEEAFLERLRGALDEARLAFEEPRGRSPIAAPAVRAALGWLELASAPLNRDATIDLLRSRAVDPAPFIDGATLTERQRRALELAGRLGRIPVRTDRDGTLLADVLAAEIANDSDEGWLLGSLDRILAARAELATAASRSSIAGKVSSMWRALGLVDPGRATLGALLAAESTDSTSPEARLVAAQLRDHAAGFRALLAAVDRVEAAGVLLGAEKTEVTPARFRAELEKALAGVEPSGTRRPGALRLVRISEVHDLPTDLLILARVSEGTFEAGVPGPSILNERVLAALPSNRRPPPAAQTMAANRVAYLGAIAKAGRVVVTRSETDAEGRPLAPAALFRELAPNCLRLHEPASRVHPRARILSSRGAELARLARGGKPDDADVRWRVALENDRLAFFLDPRQVATSGTGAIETGDETVREHLRQSIGGTRARPIAATTIERAAQCRFSAFAVAVLGASFAETLGEGLEPWQRGSLIHRALYCAFESLRGKWDTSSRTELVARGSAAAKKTLMQGRSSPLYRAEIERALRDVAAVLEWSLDDPDFRFAYGERSFGDNRTPGGAERSWPALALGTGASTVFVRGRIDRVDLSRDGSRARVIDYKTGALPAWKDVGTLVFQPPLYAYAVLKEMGRLSLPELRALYLDTSKRPPRPLPVEKGQVFSLEAMAAAEQRAAQVVARLWQGDVAPRPADAAVCSRCEVRDICRRPAAMPVEDLEPDNDGAGA